MLIKPGEDFLSLPVISALLMVLGSGATLGDVARLYSWRIARRPNQQ